MTSPEELKLKASEAEKAYDKSLADARVEANRIVDENRAAQQADLNRAMERADAQIAEQLAESETRIAEIRDSATANVEQIARETAEALVTALGGDADSQRISRAVNDQMGGTA